MAIKNIGKVGEQSLSESWLIKGWAEEGEQLWWGLIPYPTGENLDELEAAITAALGTPFWEIQGNLWTERWAMAKRAAWGL